MSTKITHYIHGDLNSQVANDGDVLAWDDDEKIYKPTKIPAYITTKKVATLPSTPAINTLYLVITGTENVYHQYLQTEDELIDMGLTTIEVAVATDGETIQENANKELEVKLKTNGGITSDTNGLKIDPGTNNAGKILRVNSAGTGAEWKGIDSLSNDESVLLGTWDIGNNTICNLPSSWKISDFSSFKFFVAPNSNSGSGQWYYAASLPVATVSETTSIFRWIPCFSMVAIGVAKPVGELYYTHFSCNKNSDTSFIMISNSYREMGVRVYGIKSTKTVLRELLNN